MAKNNEFINREIEREEFKRMLKFDDNARLLSIQGKNGQGKSSLLRRLQYECHYIEDIPASLISLDDSKKTASVFDLVKAIREDLKRFVGHKFRKFDALDNARMLKDPDPFTDLVGGSTGGTGFVNAENAEVKERAIVAGKINQVFQNVNNLTLNQHNEWPSDDYEEFVRQYCIVAFYEDLKVICKDTPVVILLDSWEKCEESLRISIVRPMLHENCFDIDNRPDKLIFVLAGEELPPLKERLGSQYSSLVVNRDKLSEWSFEHMKEFLSVNGYEGLDDPAIDLICNQVNSTKSLSWALNVARAWEAELKE